MACPAAPGPDLPVLPSVPAHASSPASARRRFSLAAAAALLVCALGLGLAAASARADSQDERRVRTGARVFRTLLLADVALESKASGDGRIDVAIFAATEPVLDEVAPLIAPEGVASRGPQFAIRHERVLGEDTAPPVALFLATPVAANDLDRLVAWSVRHGVILYSPFEGDVERGVLAGVSIEAKVLPYLNQSTLRASGIEFKPFFMKVAKVHR